MRRTRKLDDPFRKVRDEGGGGGQEVIPTSSHCFCEDVEISCGHLWLSMIEASASRHK